MARDFQRFLSLIYDSIGWIYIPLIALVLREGKGEALNIWRTYIYALGIAVVCYAFIPVSGPLYAFGAEFFPGKWIM
ncbi:MAG: phosphatase PAP2 family protein [Burkholderiaceae bacterium]